MSDEEMILNVEFPKAVRGYACPVVDSFVAQMGTRLEALQAKLEAQTSRADTLNSELVKTRAELGAFKAKETALSSAMVTMEQRRVEVEQQLAAAKTAARDESELIVAKGHETVAGMLAEAQREADTKAADAESACTAQRERLRALSSGYEETVERVRHTLERQLALLPSANGCVSMTDIALASTGMEAEETAKAA